MLLLHDYYVIFIWISCYFYQIPETTTEQDLGTQIIEIIEEQGVETQHEAMQVECQTQDQIEGQIQDDIKSDDDAKSDDESKSDNDETEDDQSKEGMQI